MDTESAGLSPKLVELIQQYELSNQAEAKSPNTVRGYNDILNQLLRYLKAKLGSDDLSVFNITTMRRYIIFLRERFRFQDHPYTPAQNVPLSPRTIQCHARSLKAFATWLYEEEYTAENRLQNLKLPKAPLKMIKPLTEMEILQITGRINQKSISGRRNYIIVNTLLDTGLRAQEVTTITLNKSNLTEGHITVIGKGDKERIVPIGKYVQALLMVYINSTRPALLKGDCDTLFLSTDGKPMTVNSLKLMFSRLAKESGVTRLHAHLCRHTFAINYLMNGGDIFSLKEILGHTTLEMVSHYLHFTQSQLMARHNEFSPMDRLQAAQNEGKE